MRRLRKVKQRSRLRCPTYRENSHANHTWDSSSRQSACFSAPEAPSGSIPIARSTFRCFPLAFVLGEAFARCSVSKASMRRNSSHSLRILRMQNGTSWRCLQQAKSSGRAAHFVRQSANYPGWTNQSDCLTILPIVRMGANQWRSQQLPVRVRRLSPKKCGPLRISSPAIEFISPFLRTARLLCA
jgi:hypothetical protein